VTEPTRGDELKALLTRTDYDELIALASRRFPEIRPDQALARYLADCENCILAIEAFLAEH